MTTISYLQADDLSHLLRLYQQSLGASKSQEDFNFIKYEAISMNSESDKKLLSRFLSRICEIFDLFMQKNKLFKGKDEFNAKMQCLQEQLFNKPLNLSLFISTVFLETRKVTTANYNTAQIHNSRSLEPNDSRTQINQLQLGSLNNILVKEYKANEAQRLPTWQCNTLENKIIYNFYENQFWKLYDIMFIDKDFISSMFIMHQTKQQNSQRLLKLMTERNQYLSIGDWCKQLDNFQLIIQKRLKNLHSDRHILSKELNISSYVRPIIMFGNNSLSNSPMKRHQINSDRRHTVTKMSPSRRVIETRDGRRSDYQRYLQLQQSEQISITSPRRQKIDREVNLSTYSTQHKRPVHVLYQIPRKPNEEVDMTSITYSPQKPKQSSLFKSFVMNFPDIKARSQEPKERYNIIHHKEMKPLETKKIFHPLDI